jgi:hypothetical protein
VKSSLGKNDKDSDLIPEGKQRFRHKLVVYFTLATPFSNNPYFKVLMVTPLSE